MKYQLLYKCIELNSTIVGCKMCISELSSFNFISLFTSKWNNAAPYTAKVTKMYN